MDMMEGVGKEHIYESPKNIERKPPYWLVLTYKNGKKLWEGNN